MSGGSSDFNRMTAPGAYDIYVLVQNGDNSFVPVAMNIPPEAANSFKHNVSGFSDSLDPSKVVSAASSEFGNLNLNATYYPMPAVKEGVLHQYKDAYSMVVDAYNDLAAEHGIGSSFAHDLVDDFDIDSRELASSYENINSAVSVLFELADTQPPASAGDDYKDKLDYLAVSQEGLARAMGFVQQVNLISNEIQGPVKTYDVDLDWSKFEFDSHDSSMGLSMKP